MEVFIERENKTINLELKEEKILKEILKELKISTESIILIKNNEICLEDDRVENSDKIKLLSVVSGG